MQPNQYGGLQHGAHRLWLKQIAKLGLLMMMGVSMGACSKSWKEEVLLHDGSKIIVDRSVEHGGRHELFQSSSISEQSLTFTLPNSNERIIWEDHYSEDIGGSNFNPMLLEIVNGIAYVLSSPAGTLSFSKWGCPNPPYVIFKFQNKAWSRISIQELPAQIKVPNLVISSPDEVAKNAKYGVLSVEMIRRANEGFKQPEFRTILRESVKYTGASCLERINGGWRTLGGPKLAYPITPPDTKPDTNTQTKP